MRLSLRYPTYGYRRITAVLLRQGYTVGHRRVARLIEPVGQHQTGTTHYLTTSEGEKEDNPRWHRKAEGLLQYL